jgi:thiaminase/transcriptional activator TenA
MNLAHLLLVFPSVVSAGQGQPPLSEWLRAEAGEQWERVVSHRFTDELAAGAISGPVLRTYLIQDHRFLDDFTVLLASMIAHAPSLADRVPGAQFLGLITGKENTYFERSLRALGVSAEAEAAVPNAPITLRFKRLMRSAAASGKLASMLAVLVVAEWSYETWGERVSRSRAAELPFYCSEWIELHAGPYFNSVVAYLRGLLDAAGRTLTEGERDEVRAIFLEAVACEEAFFDAAYDAPYAGELEAAEHDEL